MGPASCRQEPDSGYRRVHLSKRPAIPALSCRSGRRQMLRQPELPETCGGSSAEFPADFSSIYSYESFRHDGQAWCVKACCHSDRGTCSAWPGEGTSEGNRLQPNAVILHRISCLGMDSEQCSTTRLPHKVGWLEIRFRVNYESHTASYMATIFCGGTSARMLWTCWNTNPPPARRTLTCSLTCL